MASQLAISFNPVVVGIDEGWEVIGVLALAVVNVVVVAVRVDGRLRLAANHFRMPDRQSAMTH